MDLKDPIVINNKNSIRQDLMKLVNLIKSRDMINVGPLIMKILNDMKQLNRTCPKFHPCNFVARVNGEINSLIGAEFFSSFLDYGKWFFDMIAETPLFNFFHKYDDYFFQMAYFNKSNAAFERYFDYYEKSKKMLKSRHDNFYTFDNGINFYTNSVGCNKSFFDKLEIIAIYPGFVSESHRIGRLIKLKDDFEKMYRRLTLKALQYPDTVRLPCIATEFFSFQGILRLMNIPDLISDIIKCDDIKNLNITASFFHFIEKVSPPKLSNNDGNYYRYRGGDIVQYNMPTDDQSLMDNSMAINKYILASKLTRYQIEYHINPFLHQDSIRLSNISLIISNIIPNPKYLSVFTKLVLEHEIYSEVGDVNSEEYKELGRKIDRELKNILSVY